MKILVTGVAGFVGLRVAQQAIRDGHEVYGLGHGATGLTENFAVLRDASVTLPALEGLPSSPEIIIHCAGGASVARSVETPLAEFRRTVDSTAVVLEFARKCVGEVRVVLPSSAAVYGLAETFPMHPDDPCNPTSPYGLHKAMAEGIARSYAARFDVPIAIVRLFSIYGAGLRKQLLWDACGKLSQGPSSFFGTGQETRDWLHVHDASRLLLAAAMRASIDSPIVNGGSGQSVAIADILKLISDTSGFAEASFTGDVRPGDPVHYRADISGALDWGWAPTIPLERGIADYVAWYREGIAK